MIIGRGRGSEGLGAPDLRGPTAVLGGVVALSCLLVACTSGESDPPSPSPSGSAPQESASPESPEGSLEPEPTVSPDPELDAASIGSLFLTPEALATTIPAAASGVEQSIGPGELPWGLPEGSSVEPASCTVARTVVLEPPVAFDARGWVADGLDMVQKVIVFEEAAGAQAAFAELAETVRVCGEYAQVNPGVDGGTWVAGPPTDVAAPFPGLWREVEQHAEGTVVPGYGGYVLVGNVIVSWTASAVSMTGTPTREMLGSGEAIDAMVQAQAGAAVTGTADDVP